MAKKNRKVKNETTVNLELYRKTRNRVWGIKPVTQIVPNKKARQRKQACRRKVGEE